MHATWLATVMFAALGIVHEGPAAITKMTGPDWLAVGYLAVAVTAAAFVLWYSSVRRLGASRAGLLTGIAPVAAAVSGVLLGGPAPSPLVWAGIAVVAAGLALGFRKGRTLCTSSTRPPSGGDFPALVPGVMYAEGITADAAPGTDHLTATAKERLADGPESEFPEIQAWRRAFARMGLKPTQYRCAAESLLRRFRKEGSLPRLHPLVDLCNAVSLAFAVPVAVLDADQIAWPLEVRYASGDEDYLTFGGEVEHPAPGEVIFADQAGQAHARRWTNRQSGRSAVSPATNSVLIVAEALHERAPADIARAHQDPHRRDRQDLDP